MRLLGRGTPHPFLELCGTLVWVWPGRWLQFLSPHVTMASRTQCPLCGASTHEGGCHLLSCLLPLTPHGSPMRGVQTDAYSQLGVEGSGGEMAQSHVPLVRACSTWGPCAQVTLGSSNPTLTAWGTISSSPELLSFTVWMVRPHLRGKHKAHTPKPVGTPPFAALKPGRYSAGETGLQGPLQPGMPTERPWGSSGLDSDTLFGYFSWICPSPKPRSLSACLQ